MKKAIILVMLGLGADRAWAGPSWCAGSSFSDELDLRDLSSDDPEKVILALAQAACAPTAEADAHRAEIDAQRQAWGKRFGLADGDWGDVIAWANAGEGRSVKLEYSTKDLSQFTPLDQYKAIIEGFQMTGGNGSWKDPIYLADALDPRLSEVARYGYIKECLAASTSTGSSAPPAATWALCQEDVTRFDLAKFHEELRADAAHGGDIKMALRFETRDLKKRLEDHAAAVAKARTQDPAYEKMFEVAAAGRREWETGLAKDGKLLDLTQQMESAFFGRSRKQYEGCEEKTAAALVAAVSKVPASTFKDMKDQRFDPYGGFAKAAGPALVAFPEVNLAASAYVLCQPKTGTGDFLAYYLQDTVGNRGPRTLAFSRMLAEKLTLDDLNEKIYWPETRRPYRRVGGSMGSAGGVIDASKVDGKFVTVTLERFIVKRNECVESHRTDRISRILPDGTLEYELICDKMGIVSHDQTWGDFKIRQVYAPLLEKGVKFSSVNGADESGADIIVLWPNKSTDMPSWILGARVK